MQKKSRVFLLNFLCAVEVNHDRRIDWIMASNPYKVAQATGCHQARQTCVLSVGCGSFSRCLCYDCDMRILINVYKLITIIWN